MDPFNIENGSPLPSNRQPVTSYRLLCDGPARLSTDARGDSSPGACHICTGGDLQQTSLAAGRSGASSRPTLRRRPSRRHTWAPGSNEIVGTVDELALGRSGPCARSSRPGQSGSTGTIARIHRVLVAHTLACRATDTARAGESGSDPGGYGGHDTILRCRVVEIASPSAPDGFWTVSTPAGREPFRRAHDAAAGCAR